MTDQGKFSQIAMAAAQALSAEPTVDVELYLPRSNADGPVLYRKSGVGLTRPDFEKLQSSGVQHVFVRSKDLGRCEAVLEAKLGDLLNSAKIQTDEKTRIVHQVGTSVARDLTKGPISADDLQRAANFVDNVIGFVLDDPIVAGHMLQMAAHERSTASHMFVVSTLAVILGAEVFGEDYEMLASIGLAGMMHDIGKLCVDQKILNKPTALTAEEASLIQQHPIESVRLIGDHPQASPAIRKMIVQHHEWVNGGGYPIGLTGEDLHPGSQVLSIVDSFHAMIGRRPYRAPMAPPDAVRVLNTQAGRQFDPKTLSHWTDLFKRCWLQDGQRLLIDTDSGSEEVTSRHEHRPVAEGHSKLKRRSKRFDCSGEVAVKCIHAGNLNLTVGQGEFTAPVQDVSRGGLCMFSPDPMYRGEVVHVQIEQGGHQLWVRGVVVWCRQHDLNVYRVGLKFVERITEDEAREQIQITASETPNGSQATGPPPAGECNGKGQSKPRQLTELSSADALIKLTAIMAVRPLPQYGEETAITLLGSADCRVRLKAIEVLKAAGTDTAWEALLRLRADPDPEVRDRAVEEARSFRAPAAGA